MLSCHFIFFHRSFVPTLVFDGRQDGTFFLFAVVDCGEDGQGAA